MAGSGIDAWAEFAKVLVEAGAIRPAVGIAAIFLCLAAVETSIGMFPSDPLLVPVRILAGVLGLSGAWAVCSFLLERKPK